LFWLFVVLALTLPAPPHPGTLPCVRSGETGNFVITGFNHADVQQARSMLLGYLPPGAIDPEVLNQPQFGGGGFPGHGPQPFYY